MVYKTALFDNSPPCADELEKRLKFLSFTQDDEERVKAADVHLTARLDEMMEHLYSHFLENSDTAAFFKSDEMLERAKAAQKKYFTRLTKGGYDSDYVKDRWQIGTTHHRIELDPKWYLGAYCKALLFMRTALKDSLPGDQFDETMMSLTKIIFFDMSYAIDTYILAKERALRAQRDSIQLLETEKKVTKSILESAPLGIVRLDNDLKFLEVNQEFLNLSGQKERSDVIGANLSDICPNLDLKPFHEALASGHPYQGQADGLAPGSTDIFEWAVWPVTESELHKGVAAMFANITDRTKLQQQREDFVATLTHDLKTPILAANRALALLMEGDFGAVSDAQKQILSTIHQSNDALYQLVLTLLDVYRYDSGAKQLSVGPYDLSDIAERVVNELSPLASNKNIQLTFTHPKSSCLVLIDPDEIRRVVQNLVDNSLKFTPSGGSITLTVETHKNSLVLSVKDTGRGIKDEDRPKLFQRFWQSASGGRYYASTGLGLYLCRKIIDIHNGKIWCESEQGKGSNFCFSLPLMDLEGP